MGRWLQKYMPKSYVIYPVGAFFERPRANTVRPYRSNICKEKTTMDAEKQYGYLVGRSKPLPYGCRFVQRNRLYFREDMESAHTGTRWFILFSRLAPQRWDK